LREHALRSDKLRRELEQRIKALTDERKRFVKGLSFRVGRFLTAPLRALLGKP
jgi:hypothetical protein